MSRDLDLDSDEEKAQDKLDERDLAKRTHEEGFKIIAIARGAILEQALQFILNARKVSATSARPNDDTLIPATLTHAQWEQIEELLEK